MVGVLTARLPFPGPRRAWDLYCLNLQKRPILTKSFTSLLGFAIGDAVAQLSNRPSRRDRETQAWGYASRLLSLVHLSVLTGRWQTAGELLIKVHCSNLSLPYVNVTLHTTRSICLHCGQGYYSELSNKQQLANKLRNIPLRRSAPTTPYFLLCRYDTYRTIRLAAYGTIVAGPLGHFWFGFLDSHVFASAPKRQAMALMTCTTFIACIPEAWSHSILSLCPLLQSAGDSEQDCH